MLHAEVPSDGPWSRTTHLWLPGRGQTGAAARVRADDGAALPLELDLVLHRIPVVAASVVFVLVKVVFILVHAVAVIAGVHNPVVHGHRLRRRLLLLHDDDVVLLQIYLCK
jgi:hypothetical protein